MKKLLVFCLMLCLLLAGCGAATTESTAVATPDPADTDPTTASEVILGPLPLTEIGEFSDAPGGIMTLDDLRMIEAMRIEAIDPYGYQYIYAWEYSFALDCFTFYYAEEIYDEQTIYVQKGEDTVGYVSAFNDPVFYPDPYADQLGYTAELDGFKYTIEYFVHFSVPQENVRYKRVEDTTMPTGDAYVYEIYTGTEHTGYVLIDKATGLAIAHTDSENNISYQITKIDMENAGIPEYK